jgi:5-methylcytosine-specific restriction endonuclease McrA
VALSKNERHFSMSVIEVNPQLEYWGEISLRKAILKLVKEKADTLAHNGKLIGYTQTGKPIYYPLVIQLRRLVIVKYKSAKVHFSHSAVFDRDNNHCQYWHFNEMGEPFIHKCTETERTIDHVVPTSRQGRKTDFRNVVCACRRCNELIKKNRTPEEAGLKLIRKPLEPKRVIGDRMLRQFAYNPEKESHAAFAKIRPDLI